MAALWPTPTPVLARDIVDLYTSARRARHARLGAALQRLGGYATDVVSTFARRICAVLRTEKSRCELLELDDYQLRDVGLTRADVLREAAKLRPLSTFFACGAPLSAAVRRQFDEQRRQAW